MSLINDALKRARQNQQKQTSESAAESPLQPVEAAPAKKGQSAVAVVGAAVLLLAGCWFLWQWLNPPPPTSVALAKPPATTNKTAAAPKSSIASNLTRPFQAVAKLDTALKAARETETNPPAPAPQAAPPTQAVARPTPPTTVAAPPTQVSSAPPPAPSAPPNAVPAKSTEVVASAKARPATATNEVATSPPAASDAAAQLGSRNVAFPPLKLGGIYFRMTKPSALLNNRTLFVGDEVEGVRVVGIERHSVKVEWKGATKELFLK